MTGVCETDFRTGDRGVEIAGQPHRLRLSVSALAEIAARFEAESPKALAAHLRRAALADWNIILRCTASPRVRHDLTRDEMLKLIPELGALMTEGLRA